MANDHDHVWQWLWSVKLVVNDEARKGGSEKTMKRRNEKTMGRGKEETKETEKRRSKGDAKTEGMKK